MYKNFTTKRYKARDYGKGRFIRLPKEAIYDNYDCYVNPVTGSIVYIAAKPAIIQEPDRRIIEEGIESLLEDINDDKES
jgi:hypothetical protein